ncbi:MAG: ABC transporter ATP-binding protein [Mycoplasmatales bacterium]
MIKLTNIEIAYKNNVVQSNFNLNVKAGEYIVLTGKSGSGKTSILYILGMLLYPTNGTVEICGIKNPKLNSKEGLKLLQDKIGFIFQNFVLVEAETVKQNLMYALDPNAEFTIEEALEYVGLSGYEEKFIHELSGGEQQRIAIARVLVKQFDIILGDEITGSLDSENRDIVLGLLDKLNKLGKTIILVTHDEYVANRIGRRIRIEKN